MSSSHSATGAAPTLSATYLGRQLIAEFYNCPAEALTDRDRVEAAMIAAAEACRATIVNSVFHTFNPHGVSGAVIIAESHLAIHTWPEHGYAAVDVFTCGDSLDSTAAVASLATALVAETYTFTEIHRGNTQLLGALRARRAPCV